MKKLLKGLLTDLDGTLLDIDMDYFIPHYLKSMNDFAVRTGLAAKDNHLIPLVLEGTSRMMKNQDIRQTNEEVFMNCFFQDPYFAERKEQSLEFFRRFYDEIFPELCIYCKTFPFAPALVDAMFETGLPVVIATSPVFPLRAIEARLKWAGIADYPFTLITSYEVMHTCKPHINYFMETAGMAGLDAKDCLMIGNDKQDDLPAVRTGMRTFLLEEAVLDNGKGAEAPSYQGKSQALMDLLKKIRQV